LQARGLIRRVASKNDRRSRTLEITAKGRALSKKLTPLWNKVADATADLLDEAAPHFVKELDALDLALVRRPMFDRIKQRSRS